MRRGRGARVSVLDQDAPAARRARSPRSSGAGWEGAAVLDRLGMGGALDADVATLSGGQAKRVALARALVAVGGAGGPRRRGRPAHPRRAHQPPRPRRHRLAGGLAGPLPGRARCSSPTTATCSTGSPPPSWSSTAGKAYVHVGGYQSWLDARAEREARAAGRRAKRRNLARAELAWLRRGAPARTRKPQARIDVGHRARRRPGPRRRPAAGTCRCTSRRPASATRWSSCTASATATATGGCSAASTWPSTRASGSAIVGPERRRQVHAARRASPAAARRRRAGS